MSEATRICAACLGTTYSAIGRFRADDNSFILEAAFGLPDVSEVVLKNPSLRTPFGRAYLTGKPVASTDLASDTSFSLPPLYADLGVISILVVPIAGGMESDAYGVLAVGSTIRRPFDIIDANFLSGFANVLRPAIDAAKQGLSLHEAASKLQQMIADRDRYVAAQETIVAGKDRLLEAGNTLTRELRHRVRNNLQLIVSMLRSQLNITTDPGAIEGFGKIERRVMMLVEIYEQLLGTDLGPTINFGGYLSSICSKFSSLNSAAHPNVKLTCQTVPVTLGLDEVTALGLVITELVTNSYSHAFPDSTGTISVSLSVDQSGGNGAITLVDDGAGFVDAGENKRHGVGLVKRLMEQIGGSATLRSDRGSDWTLTFPITTIATKR